ncbi:6-hydroxymethylpterin diphosphokinase MptE-like protein [Desulfopila inferna]|uniref:6-hydroxymethylpterin diphosphokinase MptE-like protein n=1 Tax=Desulfopila inferna TaxID=468528 RepID=UPI0019642988|nr:6-hydroxymethylpterin diphosphokinase MptE-like protein [Desulfopila inferna]MBM9603018.1 DUF115 domain-containing protein [Desulfopila inferna]
MENTLGPFLENSFGDKYLFDVNGFAFDRIGARASYENHFNQDLFQENSLYIIPGSDSGLLPKYLVESGLPEGSYYIFVEPGQVYDRLEEIIPEKGFHKKIDITTPDKWLQCAEKIEYRNFVYLGNLKTAPSFAAADGRLPDYLQLTNQLREELEKIQWQHNAELGAELFHLRQFENLPENRTSASCLLNKCAGQTAIILAGGPSLDDVLPWIQENREKMVVIAVSRIARRLLEVDLSPDIIVSVDPNMISFDISKEMLKLSEKTVFVHKYHVVSALLGQWGGRSLFLGPRLPWDSTFNKDLLDAPGPTVTNSALALAVNMGFSRILLAGVDLCHSREGYTHASGSNERKAGPQLGMGKLWVETNGGWSAETTPDFHFAATQIEAQAEGAKHNGCQIVNLSHSATKIKCVEFTSHEDITFEMSSALADQSLINWLPVETSERRVEHYEAMLAELEKAQRGIRAIRKLSVGALRANEAFFGRRGKKKGNRKYRIKMDRIENTLNSEYAGFSQLLKKLGIREFLKITQGDQDRDWSEEDAERIGRIYYEAYRDSADRLVDILSNAANRLESRLEEEKEDPDLSKLATQWRSDFQPGRAFVWRHRHPHKEFSAQEAHLLETLEKSFEDILLLQETGHLKRAREFSQLGQVRGKLQAMYRQGRLDNLRHMSESLDHIQEAEAASLAHLAKGYLAELEGAPEQALCEYRHIVDAQEEQSQDMAVLEEALKRLLSLSLQNQDLDNARLIAECLAGISVAYLPYYADLLWIFGEHQTSLNLYADYLERVDTDLSVMLKVGRRYLELDLEEGARMMFEAVLEQDSSNRAARQLLTQINA